MSKISHIFLDLDGVCVNFIKGALKVHNKEDFEVKSWHFFKSWGLNENQFWSKIHDAGESFWEHLEHYDHFNDLVNLIEDCYIPYTLCSTPPRSAVAHSGKRRWVNRNFSKQHKLILIQDKYLLAQPDRLLIDDSSENIILWEKYRGIPFLWEQPWNNSKDTLLSLENLLKEALI